MLSRGRLVVGAPVCAIVVFRAQIPDLWETEGGHLSNIEEASGT